MPLASLGWLRYLIYMVLGSLDTLKQLKKDATEVRKGTECGLSFNGFEDIREGDVIQMFERIEKPGIL